MLGTGTINDPFLITDATDLDNVRLNMSASVYYELSTSIDLSGYPEWQPIGNNAVKFASEFDGKGYTISNMTITSASSQASVGAQIGLFGNVSYGAAGYHIKNINFLNCNINLNNWLFGQSTFRTLETGILCARSANLNISGINIESCSISVIKDIVPHATESIGGNCYIGLLNGYGTSGMEILSCSINSASIIGLTHASQSYSHHVYILTYANNNTCNITNVAIDNVYVQYDSKYGTHPTYTTDSPNVYTSTMFKLGQVDESYIKNTILSASSAGQVCGVAIGFANNWHYHMYSAITFGNSPPEKVYTLANSASSAYTDSTSEFAYSYYQTSSVNSTNLVIWSGSTVGLPIELMQMQSSYLRWDFAYKWRITSSLNDGLPYLKDSWEGTFIGSGTVGEPYLIYTGDQFQAITHNRNFAHYKLMADLDLSSYVPWKTIENGFDAITYFSLDGDNHVISNVLLNSASDWKTLEFGWGYVGIFGRAGTGPTQEESYVKNLIVSGVTCEFTNMNDDTISYYHISPIMCYSSDSPTYGHTFTNVHLKQATSSFNGNDYGFISYGGIVAINDGGLSFTSCSVENHLLILEGTHSNFVNAGLFTRTSPGPSDGISYCTVKNSQILLDLTCSYGAAGFADNVEVGPMCAWLYYAINDSYVYNVQFSASSNFHNHANGFVSDLDVSSDYVRNVYIGKPDFGNTPVSNIYVVSEYESNVGVTSSYADTGSIIYTNEFTASGFSGSTTEQMKNQPTYVGWDFTNVWRMDPTIQNGYPYLAWENLSTELISPSFTILYPNGGEIFSYSEMIPISCNFTSGSS